MFSNLFGRSSETSMRQPASFVGRDHWGILRSVRRSRSALRRVLFRWAYPWAVVYGFLSELRGIGFPFGIVKYFWRDGSGEQDGLLLSSAVNVPTSYRQNKSHLRRIASSKISSFWRARTYLNRLRIGKELRSQF